MLLPLFLLALSPVDPAALRCVEGMSRVSISAERPAIPASAIAPTVQSADADSALVAAYAAGETWEHFLAEARAGRAIWLKNWEGAVVPADALAQARALPAGFRLLVIAVDACSDSINTIPYLAKLVAEVPSLEMRIIKPMVARPFMEARPTPDGRAATPTVILLDAAGVEVGCWIERPAALQAKAIEARASGGMMAFMGSKQGWYDTDAGASTVREVVALLAAAASGKRGCDAAAPRG